MTDYKLSHPTDYRADIDDLIKWLNYIRKNYSSSSEPTVPDPEEGQLWWDSDNDYYKAYDGSDWIEEIVIDASTSQKGISSFNSDDFGVSSGAVSLGDDVVKDVSTDSGAVTPATHTITIAGGDGIDTSGSGSTITIATESNVCKMATGSYTGDGSLSQTITVTGIDVKFVMIWVYPTVADELYTRGDNFPTNYTFSHTDTATNEHIWGIDQIASVGDGNFVVDDAAADNHPNTNGVAYYYVAFGV